MNRRCFLGTAASALAAGVSVQAATGSDQQPNGGTVRFGVRGPITGKTLRERARLLHELGYEGIELGADWLNRPASAIQEDLEGTGIAVSAIVGSIKLLDPDPAVRAQAVQLDRQRLDMAKALGASAVIEVPVFGPNRFQDLSPIMTAREVENRLLVSGLKQLVPDVRRTGVNILLEPIARKWTHMMVLQSEGAEIIQAVGAPGFKLLTDFFHMQLEEKDIVQTLALYGKYTGYVHMADGEKRTEPGSLPFDYRPGFRALKKWGFSGWLTVEAEASDNAKAALARALGYVKRQWSEA